MSKPFNRRRGFVLVGVALLLALGSALLCGCGGSPMPTPSPTRSCSLLDLLLELEDLPQGFTVYKGPQPDRDVDMAGRESVTISWDRMDGGPEVPAAQSVFRYIDADVAKRVWKHVYLVYASVLPSHGSLSFQSETAVETSFVCNDVDWPGGRKVTLCEWAAVYEEYIVIFRAAPTPEGMTTEDIERAVRAIDARFNEYLHLGGEK